MHFYFIFFSNSIEATLYFLNEILELVHWRIQVFTLYLCMQSDPQVIVNIIKCS